MLPPCPAQAVVLTRSGRKTGAAVHALAVTASHAELELRFGVAASDLGGKLADL
jgi:hypothetical protein